MMLNGSSMSGQFSATGSPMFAGKEKVEREKYDDGYVASSFPRRVSSRKVASERREGT
jgi:hypothetical protein